MKVPTARSLSRLVLSLAVGGLVVLPPAAAWSGSESGAELTFEDKVEERISFKSYSNLAELVSFICDDAMEVFHNFYGPAKVAVSPFSVISDYQVKKYTMLGVTLADQMTAMINSEPAVDHPPRKRYEQVMGGVIEEMDGYLRVHISGRNVWGERRGYVVHVEMSEPIYRFLHSYVESH